MAIGETLGVRRSGARRASVVAISLLVTVVVSAPGSRAVAGEEADGGDRYVVAFQEADGTTGRAQTAATGWAVVEAGPDEVAELRADPTVAHVEPDHEYHLARATGRTQADPPWGLDRIDQRERALSGTFTPGGTGAGVVVYVVDDGIDGTHADFGGRVRGGHAGASDGGGTAACSGHGSHVAGVIGGTVSGVAKEVTLVPVRVFGCDGSSSLSTVLAGLDWVLQHHDPSTRGVVNMSIEGPPSAILDARVSALAARGLVVIAAAGNGARSACEVSPARARDAIAVGATEVTDRRARFSNHGSCVDLFAPGVSIPSVSLPSGFVLRHGTSMAAPHVAGAAAILLAQHPDLTPAGVRERLVADATPGTVVDAGPGSPDRLVHVPLGPANGSSVQGGHTGSSSMAPPGVGFVGSVPERVLDTRAGSRVAAGSISMVPLVGRAGVPSGVSEGVGAVVLNVTVVDPAAAGHLTVFPCGTARPEASNLNFEAGTTVANAVVSRVGSGGICIYTSAQTHVLVDVAGSLVAGFVGQTARRVADTRSTARVAAGSALPVDVGVPAGATAVVTTVTAVDPAADGYLSVFACDADGNYPVPDSSNVNFTAGRTVANAVVSEVGRRGHVCVFASADTDVLVDVSGWSTSGVSGHWPERVLDTRSHGRVAAGAVIEARVASLPTVATGASAAVLNVTVVDPAAAGYVTVFPCGGAVPGVSTTNFAAGATVANAVVSGLGAGGEICVYASVATHVLVDVVGAVS